MVVDANGRGHAPEGIPGAGRFLANPHLQDDSDLCGDDSRLHCVEVAKRKVVDLLWRSANIEVAVTLPDTEDIFNGVAPQGIEAKKIMVVNNLKHAWMFLFDNVDWDVDWRYLSQYNKLIGSGLEMDPGVIRKDIVSISGTDYIPEIPSFDHVREVIERDLSLEDPSQRGMALFCDISRGQWFSNGNKRTAIMAANHTLIHEGVGVFSLPPEHMDVEFRTLLIDYYETGDRSRLTHWLERNAIGSMPDGLTLAQRGEMASR
jgi:hypothetical protein